MTSAHRQRRSRRGPAAALVVALALMSTACPTRMTTALAIAGAALVGGGATGLALKGGSDIPVGPISILSVITGAALLVGVTGYIAIGSIRP